MENPESTPQVTAMPGARAFQKDVAPSYLDHACIVSGFAPPPGSPVGEGVGAGFSYCELYCGSGITAALLAAANPLGDFHAIDAREALLGSGKALADDARVRNVTFHHAAMEAAQELSLPQFDYIVVDGVYSWVPARERALILGFIRRFLKPGGAAFLSYNARPGWDRLEAFRRLFIETARGRNVDPRQHLQFTRELYAKLYAAKVPAIAAGGVPPAVLKDLDNLPIDALVTDYANDFARPLYVTEAIADMAAADCVLAGSADMTESLAVLMGHEPFKSTLGGLPTPSSRELVKDYLRNTRSRRDVFVRGGRRLAADNREMMMNGLAFALEMPAASVRFKSRLPFGAIDFDNVHARALVAALAAGPRTLGDLIARALAEGAEPQTVVGDLHALLLTGQVRPVYRAAPEAAQTVCDMQAVIRRRAGTREAIAVLPSTVGTAFTVPVPDQIFTGSAAHGAEALAAEALARMAPDGNPSQPLRDLAVKRARAWPVSAEHYRALSLLG